MWILMGKVLLICVFSSLLYSPSSCSVNYGTTARPSASGQWSSRDSYISSSQKGYQSYDQRRDGRYGPPPLGPQLPEPLAQKIQPVGFHSSNAAADQAYLNRLSADRPSCARKRDYCLHDHDYPMDMVRSVIQRYRSDIYRMYSEMHPLPMEANGGNASYRYNFPNDRGAWACETDIFTMRIGWARNWAGRWKVVLNTDQFPQAVRLEHCKYENRSCQMMPPCVRSSCLQRYTAVQLLSADPQTPDLSPTVDTFLLPGGCSCYIEFH
ncbi:neurotrophin 1-like isoform X2 [Uloborus diversus]|uniref:neurotrophin 1-like isoform X2 n=1 Tax=Uloborus diversus TaxID=327109 RepID=UPI00240992C0|nr:neurotrophin 1-like isoform X2 [Uloborus diversus]